MSKEQYKGKHDVINDQGFAMHYRPISNMVSHLEVFRCERINGWIDFFYYVEHILKAKVFQYGFLEEHKVCINDSY